MNSVFSRSLSLLLAFVLAGLVTFYPLALAQMGHGWLSLVVWGICAGFVHGFGYRPDSRFWRVMFSPLPAWFLMGLGLYGALKSMHVWHL